MEQEYYLTLAYDLSRGKLQKTRKPVYCLATGCMCKPVDGSFCATHSPFLNEVNSEEYKEALETWEAWKRNQNQK